MLINFLGIQTLEIQGKWKIDLQQKGRQSQKVFQETTKVASGSVCLR